MRNTFFKIVLAACVASMPIMAHAKCEVAPEFVKHRLVGSKNLYTTWKLTTSSDSTFPMVASLKFKVTYLTKPGYREKEGKESSETITHGFGSTGKDTLRKGRYDYTINDPLSFDAREIIAVDVQEDPMCSDGLNDR